MANHVSPVRKQTVEKVDVLLIEDNPGDVRMTEEVLRRNVTSCKLTTIPDPERALDYLGGSGQHSGRIKPRIIFLDLNLPKISGLDLIGRIRSIPTFESLPIVVLSASENPFEVRRAYNLGANCFIRKPAALDEFMHHVSRACEFWCDIVVLPPDNQ